MKAPQVSTLSMATSRMSVDPGLQLHRHQRILAAAMLWLAVLFLPLVAVAGVPTTTTLRVNPLPATAGEVVTLTATVNSGGEFPVTVGTVSFLSGKQVLATVQMVQTIGQSEGTATLKTRFAPGMFELNAQYNANSLFQTSQSGPQSLTVTGTEPSLTTLTDQPDGNNRDLTASVFGFGLQMVGGIASQTASPLRRRCPTICNW